MLCRERQRPARQQPYRCAGAGGEALREAGFTENDLNMMFKDNPAKLVKLPVLP